MYNKPTFYLLPLLLLGACSDDNNTSDTTPEPPVAQGRWVAGDIHTHTAVSGDARVPTNDVIDHAFASFGLDYLSLSNHMRDNSQDNDDNDLGEQLYYDALVNYEQPAVQAKQAEYPGKVLWSSFEWDMPTHEHYNIGILGNPKDPEARLAAIKQFEYEFSYKNSLSDFAASDVAAWNAAGVVRQNSTHQDAVAALAWLQANFPTSSYGMLSHPRRYRSSYTISDIRDLNNAAPDVFFMIEGIVGNQFNGSRGDYGDSSAGLFGGVDPTVAEVGGWWDALLGEGRRVWNMANSDFHFKAIVPYASGYYPGEYAKTYTWVDSTSPDAAAVLAGLRSGNSFAVTGDLINALDVELATTSAKAVMGQTLAAANGDTVILTIRVKSPAANNKEPDLGDGNYVGTNPGLDHIDLIAGNVTTKAEPGTDAYAKDTNDSTLVVKTFTASDWTLDADGYYNMRYSFVANGHQYFRLRGTNLGYNVTGQTSRGNPELDAQTPIADGQAVQDWYNQLNDRNYDDLWFYSNPVFINAS